MSDTPALGDLSFEVTIQTTPAKAWLALTDDIDKWWPQDFYCGSGGSPPTQRMEAHPGGRMWEDWGNGDGLLWATALAVERNKKLVLQGHTAPEWGGPSLWIGTLTLRAEGDQTVLGYREGFLGRITPEHEKEKEQGWRYLYGGCLAAYLEGRPAPEWSESC